MSTGRDRQGPRQVALAGLLGLLSAALSACPIPSRLPEPPLSGTVHDDHGPVPGAHVRFKGQETTVLTDRLGRFHLPRPAGASLRLTAWKDGYLIAGADSEQAPLVLALERLPAKDHEDYAWIEPAPDPARPQNCGNCHGEIYREWSSGGHAHAATGRHFLNLYDGHNAQGRKAGWSLLDERPEAAGVCNACHAPTAGFNQDLRLAAGKGDLSIQDPGMARNGIHCDFCHKVAAVDNDRIGVTHGRYGFTLLRPAHGQLFFGPLDDVDRHEDSFAPVYGESRYCASCHEGTVFGVAAYSTYSEWLASPARRQGKQCQTCHMAPTGKLTNIAPGKGGVVRDPKSLANHRFFAGSQLDMLRQSLRVTAVLTSERTHVRVEVEVCAEQVGHRVPTGFVDRNLVLVAQGLDHQGQPVPALGGPVLPALTGRDIARQPGRIYAKLLQDFDGHRPAPLWRAAPEAIDTRLLPDRRDRLVADFPAQVQQVRLRLSYRRFWPEVAEVKGWKDNELAVVDQVVTIPPARVVHWSSR